MNIYYVYILTNVKRNVMYVGVTNDLERRIHEHRNGKGGNFTKRYRVGTLVYVESCEQVINAIAREKEIKAWRRSKKDALVETVNPTWADLLDDTTAKRPLAALGMTILLELTRCADQKTAVIPSAARDL